MKPADKEQRPAERTVRDCPKYDTCSIAICPLDPKWHLRAVMQGEAVCPYLRELGKPGDPVARFAGRYDAFVIDAARRLQDEIRRAEHPRYAYILQEIAASSDTPTMMEQAAARSARFEAVRARRKTGTDAVAPQGSDQETSPQGG